MGDLVSRGRLRSSLVMKIRFHPLFLLLLALAFATGLWRETVLLFLMVLSHELGHAVVAESFGYEVENITLLPFGGVARLSYGRLGFVPRHEALIALAGPGVNVLLTLFTSWLYFGHYCSYGFFVMVLQLNVWIVVFNLLPGLPLDGGRIWRAGRSTVVGYEQATLEAYRVSFVVSVLLLWLTIASFLAGYTHLNAFILSGFLFISAWTGRRTMGMDTIRFLDSLKSRLRFERPSDTKIIAATPETSVRHVVRKFSPQRYHMVYILDGQGTIAAILEEDDLLQAVFAGRWMESLTSLIDEGFI